MLTRFSSGLTNTEARMEERRREWREERESKEGEGLVGGNLSYWTYKVHDTRANYLLLVIPGRAHPR